MRKSQVILATTFMVGAMGVGILLSSSQPVTAQAKTRAAKVLSTSNLKKTGYHINGGYLFKNAQLTKKTKSSRSLLKTTLYTYKSANVKKANGKTAVYYYVKNKSGSIKGWAWRGNLHKVRSYAQQKKDIKAVLSATRTMSPNAQDYLLGYFSGLSSQHPYDDLSFIIDHMGTMDEYPEDRSAAGQLYEYFHSRFDSLTNSELAALYDRYNDAQRDGNDSDALGNAADNLYDAIAEAVSSLS